MNLHKHLLTATVATTLVGTLCAMPARAASFNNTGILFDTDTTVDFSFLKSNGYWFGEFGVEDIATGTQETILLFESLNVDPGSGVSNDNEGTVGTDNAVLPGNATASFTFEAGKEYSFFLSSYGVNEDGSQGDLQRTVFSTSSLNPERWDQNVTLAENNYDSSYDGMTVNARDRFLFEGDDLMAGLKMLIEDNGIAGDNDYDDFVVSARTSQASVPEPATLLGLGVVGGAMALRRRKINSLS
jgi:hypothetical protein